MTPKRPIWAEISRSRLLHNYRYLRRLAGADAELLAVVKADAYGHGLAGCARALAAEGARWFGVTCVEEATALRAVCPDASILAMSGPWIGEGEAIVDQRLTTVVWDPAHLDQLAAGARRGAGSEQVPVHLEIDTGMSRQGVQLRDLASILDRFGPEAPLRLEAVMTHFHSPEGAAATAEQMERFAAAVETIVGYGLRPTYLSAGSSADLLDKSTGELTALAQKHGARRMFRSGLALYGYSPRGAASDDLEPVLAWKSRVTSLRTIDAGTTAGYGATFQAQRPTRLALLPVGYADGLNRGLSNRGCVLVRGQRAPVAGRISMDQTMVDVTDIPGVTVGDEVALIGEQNGERVTAGGMAQLRGTIAYEVLCNIAGRVPRVVVD